MQTEYEATFSNIDKNKMRKKLKKAGAVLIKPEFLQRRYVFDFPRGQKIKGGWLRVRDEKDKITLSLKIVSGSLITDQKEICVIVDNFEQSAELLKAIGCPKKSYQETKRELWKLGKVEITIDHWPFLEPLVEIEGKSGKVVRQACAKIGLDYKKAFFGSADTLYSRKYGLSTDVINKIPKIIFGNNPFNKQLIKK